MAISISEAYIDTFENNVRHLAQQSQAKLRGTVQERSVQSESHNWERLGTLTASQKASARVATPTQDATWSRRVSVPSTYHIGTSAEQEDPVQMLVDPNSNLTRAIAAGMQRQIDDVIIAAATGTALDGQGVNQAFPAGQVIGNGTASITFDTVTQVQELFMQNEIDPSVPKCFVVGPTQVRKLMQLTQQTSADYVDAKALQTLNSTGIVPNWMGFTWIVSTRLLVPAAGEISCLAYTMDALGLQVNKDISTRVAEDPSLSFAWRLYAHMTLGAVRVEDEHIVHVHLLDSI
ncbi:MAG: hypothetical protein DWQ49_09950 [Bacteroidetes bacterium]|nr:MAG: hypothetical protein DWQ49_09950 [Bacteroidota bacterium]